MLRLFASRLPQWMEIHSEVAFLFLSYIQLTLGPSKLEKVVDPGSGPRGPLPEIGVHYLNLDFQGTPLVETF